MAKNKFKRREYDYDKDCYLIERDDVMKLFEMAYCDYDNKKSATSNSYCYDRDKQVAIHEHSSTLREVIELLGLYRDYLDCYEMFKGVQE